MEYEPNFAKSFLGRTLEIVNNYNGPYEATLLINSLLGLLVLPKEVLISKIPETPFASLDQWGIQPGSIKNSGRCDYGHQHNLNLRQLTRRMRNAVAHFRVEPFPKSGEIGGFAFKDKNGFHVVLTVEELKVFVAKLADHLKNAA